MHRLPRAFRLRQQPTPFPFRQHILRQRNFSLIPHRRRPQTLWRPSGEPVRYQTVRFKDPPLFTYRRALTVGIYLGVGWAYLNLILRYLDVEIEILDDDEVEDGATEGEDAEGEGREVTEEEEKSGVFYAEPDSTFIPMTWAKQLPREFYKGSDPEWQEFVKVAKDKPRHKKIQNELVQVVFSGAMQHPMISRQLGKDAKIGKYWLDISFPDGPPQDYERRGIELGDGYVAWSKQRVSSDTQWRLTRALWPQAAFDSLWATTKMLAGIQYRRAKQAMGWEEKDPFSPEERYRHALEMMQKQQQGHGPKGVSNKQAPDGSTPGAVVTTTTSAPSPNTPSATKPTSADPEKKNLPWALDIPMPNLGESTDLPIAMHVFSSTLSKSWQPKKREAPRGSFVVQGLVEVRGQRGRVIFDVQSCYDPKQGKYVVVNASVRGFKRWNQAPKGGP